MTPSILHPAIIELLWLQSRGRRRRMWRRICQPRRLVLSAVAFALAVVWLGNAAITVWLREAASEPTLRALLSLGLVLYAIWHLAKAAFFRPEYPFDWAPAERDLLAAMPLLPRDLVAYQIASVTLTTLLKAGLFTALLLPDLRCLPLAFVGLLFAMLALEMLRMAVDIITWGVSRTAYLVYPIVVVSGLVAGAFAAVSALVRGQAFARINLGEGLLERLLDILVQLNASVVGQFALPFQPFIELIVAHNITAANTRLAVTAIVVVLAAAVAVFGLYSSIVRRAARRERRNYESNREAVSAAPHSARTAKNHNAAHARLILSPLARIPHCGGAGAMAWRQLVGARRQWGSLLAAMIAPAVLSLLPCLVIADAYIAFLSTAGTLAFYTFLLLPTALRFDFRRDLDRLVILKGLPISPAAVAIGQTLAPVLIATLFQTLVLAIAVAARSLPPVELATTMLVMLPLNVFVFTLDNFIYLLYPYRVQQEGLEIFFRTMLTFTAKGLLFTVGLVLMTIWGFAAAAATRGVSAWMGIRIDAHAAFALGMVAGPAILAALAMYALSRTYQRVDPSEDIPR